MMIRDATDKLIEWKGKAKRKPLIIHGARQVGKTWLMKHFGEKHYKKVAYINFEYNQRASGLFQANLDIDSIIMGLKIETGVDIDPDNTLIIFDEIQECPRALTSLKYFNEQAPGYHILAAGSLLGVFLHQGTSFPVGKVEFMNLYPMNYLEFLNAVGETGLRELIMNKNIEMITAFKDRYISLLRVYYFVGGMPEAVAEYAERKDLKEIRTIQKNILSAYEQDFSKHAPGIIVSRIRMLWNSIPGQLSKENRKFIYGQIKSGARAKDYEMALTWLEDSGLILKVNRIKKPHHPLSSYVDSGAFKIFLLDVGLLCALCEIDPRIILEGNRLFTEFKGALTEQYVLQQLKSFFDLSVYYWTADKGTAEVDFILSTGDQILPIEVKAEENVKAKSLKSYYEKYKPHRSVRMSMSDYREDDWLTNIPLYFVPKLEDSGTYLLSSFSKS